MRLPSMKFADGIAKSKQIKFGGLNHCAGAGDGELWDMQNMTGDYYPLLASRTPRRLYRKLEQGGGLFCRGGLCWVDGTDFYFNEKVRGQVTEGRKVFAAMGAYILIYPDKCYYNVDLDEFGSLEARWEGKSLTFGNGLYAEVEASANMIKAEGVDWSEYFRTGDAVTISGCTVHPGNNQTSIIRQIDGDKLYFYENVFTLEGEDGTEEYTENGEISVARTVPELKFVCENENRLWGCTETTIYACKWDDIFNWNVMDGLDSDAWAVTPTSAGVFTGCVTYKGFVIFFKEDNIYKVYGSTASSFQLLGSASLGLAEGSGGSLAIAGETLFYLNRNGVMAYGGGIPQPVNEVFGMKRYRDAVAGSNGLKYYVSMQDEGGNWSLFVYDTQRGLWHREDESHVTHFAMWEGNLYFLNDKGEIWIVDGEANLQAVGNAEPSIAWWAEFSDFTEEDPNQKGVGKVQIRLEVDAGATAQIWIQFDSDGKWICASDVLGEDVKRSYYLPIVPRRCDHYRLKISGTGGCRIYSLVREFYSGSELKSKRGRN